MCCSVGRLPGITGILGRGNDKIEMGGWWVICDRGVEFVCRASGAIRGCFYVTGGKNIQTLSDDSDGGEEFSRFDAAGGQVRDEFAIGQEEVVGGKFAREDPGDLLEGTGEDVGLGVLGGEEMDLEFLGRVGVLVADTGDFDGFDESDAELFAQFAGEGLLEGFAGAGFSAGKLPFEGRGVPAAALADQEAAVGAFDDGGDDVKHGGDDFRSREVMKQ